MMKKQKNLWLVFTISSIGLLLSCSSGDIKKETEAKSEIPDEVEEGGLKAPPAYWQEHWFEHQQLVTRKYYDENVAVYFDQDVDPSIVWMNSYLSEVWEYIKGVYGGFGQDPRLFAIFHTDKYSGGHPSTFMDSSHDFRNVVDCGPYSWTEMKPEAGLSMVIHEIGHIVEGSANGIQHNPAWDIWKDSKWAEIFIYDVYLNTGKTEFAEQTYNDMMNQYDNFPRENTQWFKNWFYPIYSGYGGSKVLNGFYDLLALHFPKNGEGTAFSRRMNMGEFVHFWSGAAGSDLQELAKEAFGWEETWQSQLEEAKLTFNGIKY